MVSHCIEENSVEYKITPQYEFVEIGGTKWATMNVGATGITDIGLYFQWGDTQGYTLNQIGNASGKKYFDWTDYKYCSGAGTSSSAMTKYNRTDKKTILDLEDDAVKANLGGNWRMPTTEEFQAFGNAVNTEWTQVNGVSGLMCTDKIDESKKLFFPAGASAWHGTVSPMRTFGIYWSSSLTDYNIKSANLIRFTNDTVSWYNVAQERYYGYPIRGVSN